MIGALRNWIINISTIIIFITAVEMLLPSNSIKKYAKYVLGLILVVVLIQPIVSLMNGEININKYINGSEAYFSSDAYKQDYEIYKNENMSNTIESFKKNLELTLEKKLERKFPHSEFDISIDLSYEEENSEFEVNNIEVGLKDNSVSIVKEVNISENAIDGDKKEYLDDDKSKNIKNYISSELDVSGEIIFVYKL